MSKIIAEQLVQAKTTLLLDDPFWGELLYRIEFVEDKTIIDPGSGCPTIGTNGLSIRYHPDALKNLKLKEVMFLLAHEVGHLVGEHCFRNPFHVCLHLQNQFCPDCYEWNICGDFAINDILQDSGFAVLPGSCLDSRYHGLSAEEIRLLRQKNGDAKKTKMKRGNKADCYLQNGPPNSAIMVKLAVLQAAQAAKAMGKLPRFLEHLLGELLKPKIDWKTQLHQFIQQTAKADYSWARPSQRYLGVGLYLPCLKSESMPPIVIGIDTSGSMSLEEQAIAASETDAAIRLVRPEVTYVLYSDAAIAHVDTFTADDIITFGSWGGGGTDFRPVFDWIKTNGIEPACLIYFTDLCGTFPEMAPEFPVLWCTTSKDVGPFGETIHMEGI